MKVIKADELPGILMQVKGAKFASILTETVVKMNKKGNPYHDQITKRSKTNIMLNFNYENSVNNQLAREGQEANFEAQPRKWGVRIPKTSLVSHNGQLYVEVKVDGSEVLGMYHNGVEIDSSIKEEIKQFMPSVKAPNTQDTLEKKVILRDYALMTIKEIHVNNEHYVIAGK